MKNLLVSLFTVCIACYSINLNAQGVINSLPAHDETLTTNHPGCGSYELMKEMDEHGHDFLELSNEFMSHLSHVISAQQEDRAYADLYVIPIVFHIVYNEEEENLPDSVVFNQLEILNDCFRRENADASETRAEFLDLVGDAKIEFKLATLTPDGEPTNGITRTYTDIEYFGGVLLHGPGETAEIQEWVDDSLYYNFSRISQTSLGGHDAWDVDHYLNVWAGDMRIYEPAFGGAEEIALFGLATPPMDHANWPEDLIEYVSEFEQGVYLHYMNLGGNNPVPLPPPYSAYNGVVTTGEILVHEIGHYLGLRHIWGDGDCSFDDYIHDTPNASASSTWNCNTALNTCTDDINGEDLPNMVENYMDYTSGSCQNSFTFGQIDLMRTVLEDFRPGLAETISTVQVEEYEMENQFLLYPNPTNGAFLIDLKKEQEKVQILIQNSLGQVVLSQELEYVKTLNFNLHFSSGVYFAQIVDDKNKATTMKFIVE